MMIKKGPKPGSLEWQRKVIKEEYVKESQNEGRGTKKALRKRGM
jgi:hypothetical protein